jgi:hypothetical protein
MAATGFAYTETKALAEAVGWPVTDDERELGYIWFGMPISGGPAVRQFVCVEVMESGRRPRAYLPLFYFENYESGRELFDKVYQSLLQEIAETLGQPSQSGVYEYPHRPGWFYCYAWWSLANATFALVQDEFDIQFGMDVSLWVLPAGVAFEMPVSGER